MIGKLIDPLQELLADKVIAASGKCLGVDMKNAGLANEYSGENTRMLRQVNHD